MPQKIAPFLLAIQNDNAYPLTFLVPVPGLVTGANYDFIILPAMGIEPSPSALMESALTTGTCYTPD